MGVLGEQVILVESFVYFNCFVNMAEKSSSGSTPCEKRFIARVTNVCIACSFAVAEKCTLYPVCTCHNTEFCLLLSNSASVVVSVKAYDNAVSAFKVIRQQYSIWSAYTFAVAISTVEGRLIIIFLSGVGCHTSNYGIAYFNGIRCFRACKTFR